MSVDPTNAGASNIIERAKNILLTPQAEWDRIAAEPADVSKIYMGYVLPLAAIGCIASFIGLSVIGASAFGITYRVPIVTGAISAALQLAAYVGGIYVIALIANALAPNFGSQPDQGQAHKLMAYSFTAAMLAGIFSILPALAILGILGLYSFVLLYIGLPRLMKTPEDKRIGYFATLVVIGIVVFFVIGAVLGSVRTAGVGLGGLGAVTIGQNAPAPRAADNAEIALPGGGSINLAELERAAAQGGQLTAVAPERLANFLPQSLPGGFSRVSSSSATAMGTAQAEAEYANGDARLTLTVMHMGAMGGIASMAGAMNVQENRQDSDGYTRTQTIDGRVVTEEVSASAGTARYGVIGRGVAITAEGHNGVSADQVRAAVDTIGVRRLESEFAAN